MDRQSVRKYISCIETKAHEGSAYTVHRHLSQGHRRASGIRLFALLTFLPSFEGKCRDLTRSFTDLKPNCGDLRRFLHHLLMSATTLKLQVEQNQNSKLKETETFPNIIEKSTSIIQIHVENKFKMNNGTHFQTLIKIAI